jgi:FkbM family methyltransferase
MTVNVRGLLRNLVTSAPSPVRKFVRKRMTSLHVTSAAAAARAHSASRKVARAASHDWGFFTLYLPGVEHPLYARPRTSDLEAFHTIFGRRQQAVDLGFDPRLIVDLGANVGYASVDFALRYPEARVVAVEPEPSNVELLRRNVAGLPVDVVEAAVWPRAAELELEETEIGHLGFRVREVSSSDHGVSTVTIPMLMERQGWAQIDLLKIDIEGAELELLSEEAGWLERVRAISIEFHDTFRPGCSVTGQAALARAGFRLRLREPVSGAQYFVREPSDGEVRRDQEPDPLSEARSASASPSVNEPA